MAVVNGVPVTRRAYFTRLAALAAEKRSGPPSRSQRKQVLDQLVAEELLLGRALELGLPHKDSVTRRRLVAAMVEHLTAEADRAGSVSEAEARRYYQANLEKFRGVPRYLANRIFFRGTGAESGARAEAAHSELKAGLAFTGIKASRGDAPLLGLPHGALQATALRRYLGPTAARTVTELQPGSYSSPVKAADGFSILLLERKEAGAVMAWEMVRGAAEAMIRRERRAEQMERGLSRIKRASTVTTDSAVLDPETPIPTIYLKAARAVGSESNGK